MTAEPDIEVVLPTYAVLTQLSHAPGVGPTEAVHDVEVDLISHEAPFDTVAVERQEADGSWRLRARFVVVSVDGHTAVEGVHETLIAAGLHPDEVWLDRQIA